MPGRTNKPSAGKSALPRVAAVVSRYNWSVTGRLLEGALDEYESRGGKRADVVVVEAAGSFELTAVALAAAESEAVEGVVALGCIMKGQTRHDEYLAQAVALGLTEVTLDTGVPVAFGVLTVDTPEQAKARSGGAKGNKGAEAMGAVLETIGAMTAARRGRSYAIVRGGTPDKAARRAGESR